MAMKLLSLFVLLFSVKTEANQKKEEARSSLERADSNCKDSQPFFIKNRSAKAKNPYLTVDLETNAVNGEAKTGEGTQQWIWRNCDWPHEAGTGMNLVNVATGGCLAKKGKKGLVSSKCKKDSVWFYAMQTGTLRETTSSTWARLVKKKSALKIVKNIRFFKGTTTPLDWFRWDIENVEGIPTTAPTTLPSTPPTTVPTTLPSTPPTTVPNTPPYKLQPEDPGCYESDCPPGCQLVLIAKLKNSLGGLYYGIPAKESHIAVTPNTRLYKSTGQTSVGASGDFALTYFMFHHRELNMWVIGEGEDALTSLGSEKIKVQSGVSGSSVVPVGGWEQWTYEQLLPYCMDMDSDNFCQYEGYAPDETSRSLMHESYPFSGIEDGKIVSQFTYKGETYEVGQRRDSEGALIYATRGLPVDLPIMGRKNLERQYRVFSFSEKNGFRDIEDFDPSLAVTDRLNDGRHVQAAAIHAGLRIPASSGLAWGKEERGSATSWELRMDITVTHSTNATYFKTVGWGPGGYSGIQQTPDTRTTPSGKNFIFSMWDTNTDHWGNADPGTTPVFSYLDELNEEADVGGQIGVINKKFGGEGTGQQIKVPLLSFHIIIFHIISRLTTLGPLARPQLPSSAEPDLLLTRSNGVSPRDLHPQEKKRCSWHASVDQVLRTL